MNTPSNARSHNMPFRVKIISSLLVSNSNRKREQIKIHNTDLDSWWIKKDSLLSRDRTHLSTCCKVQGFTELPVESNLEFLYCFPSCKQFNVSFTFLYMRVTPTWKRWGRGSSVGRAFCSWWGGPGLDFRCGRPLPTGWVGVSIMWPAETEVMVSQLCLVCGST